MPERERQRLSHDERRDAILDVATKIFANRAFSDVSVREIAEAADVATGLIHHYFDSKRGLYLEVVKRWSYYPPVPPSGTEDDSPFEDRWTKTIDALFALLDADPDWWLRAISFASAEHDVDVSAIVEQSRDEIIDQVIAALDLHEFESPRLRALIRCYGRFVEEATVEYLVRKRLTRAEARTVIIESLPAFGGVFYPELR